MSGRAPITPWSAGQEGGGTGVSGEPLARRHRQALQPLIDGALMASSTYLESLFAALAEAQGDMQSAEKNQLAKVGRDGATRMYADLAAVLTALKPLSAVGLAVMQLPLMDLSVSPPRISVATVLGHSSGQWIGVRLDADAPTQAGMNDLQALGNAISYLRRYGLSAITGVAQQDTDGAGGSGQPERDPRQEPAGQKLRAEIDGMIGKLTPDKVAAAENAWQRSRTMPELAQVRNRVKELAAAPAQSAPAPAAKQEHTPERAAKINRLVSALDAVQASDAAVAKRMTAADQMATADLELYVLRMETYARGEGAPAEGGGDDNDFGGTGLDHRAEQQELGVGVGGAE